MDNVTTSDVVFESADVSLVARLADVGGVFLVWTYRRLWGKRNGRRKKCGDGGLDGSRGSGVDSAEGGGV